MKKIRIMVLGFMFFFLLAYEVSAQDISSLDDLRSCLNTDGSTCKLVDNIVVSDTVLETNGEVSIDLNGYEISPANTLKFTGGLIVVNYGSTLTVNGEGKITGGDSNNLYAGITLTKKGTTDKNGAANLIVNGGIIEGYYYGISGNGTRHNTNVTINGGEIKALSVKKDEEGTGIYNPQNGSVTINGGTVIGATGIEIRSGKLLVTGGKIIGTLDELETSANGNGTTTLGAGIAVAQHDTNLDIDVTIKGGEIEGSSALYESNPQTNSQENISKVKMSIIGGTFTKTSTDGEVVYSEDLKKFITGGIYSHSIDDKYIADTYIQTKENDKYVVRENTVITTDKEDVLFESDVAMPNDYKLVVSDVEEDYKNISDKVDAEYKDNTDVLDVKVIKVYDISIVDSASEYVEIEDGKFKISIEIDEDNQKYDVYKVVYIDDNGNIKETFDAKLEDGKVVFETTHLSTYGIIGYNNKEVTTEEKQEENPKTYDNILNYVMITGIGVVASLILYSKKKKLG